MTDPQDSAEEVVRASGQRCPLRATPLGQLRGSAERQQGQTWGLSHLHLQTEWPEGWSDGAHLSQGGEGLGFSMKPTRLSICWS